METPLEIDFQGVSPGLTLQSLIEDHVANLEKRFGRITSCRVVLKGPGHHHRTGGIYEVNIHMTLPTGREVNVSKARNADERHADVNFALNDAFKRARRQLQDRVRKIQGKVKHHEGPPLARVKEIDPSGEYGFLEGDDGREIYFHKNSVVGASIDDLEVGARVSFAEGCGDKGPQASTVKLLGKHGLR